MRLRGRADQEIFGSLFGLTVMIFMQRVGQILCLFSFISFSIQVLAVPIAQDVIEGDHLITFSELALTKNEVVTDQFESQYGVVFTGGWQWFDLPGNLNGITGGALFEAYADNILPSDLGIEFTSVVNLAGFSFRTADRDRVTSIRMTALLDGVVVDVLEEVYSAVSNQPETYAGFVGVNFNRIEISMLEPDFGTPCCGANMDNLEFTFADNFEVSLPSVSSFVLFLFGFLSFILIQKKAVRFSIS